MARLKDSLNYKNIVASVDFRYGRRQTLIMALTSAVALLVARLKYPDPEALRVFLILWALLMAPVVLWCLIRWLEIFIKPDGYVFFTAKLDQPNLAYRRGIYYTVTGADREGRPIVANTRRMFGYVFEPNFEEYNNLQVLAGYNQRTGRLIIVRKAIYD